MTERTVLLIAFHYPPMQGSSGIQRTLRFAKYLPRFGWKPIVLTATPGAYEAVTPHGAADTAAGVEVIRARALDAARHLSIFGRYPRRLATPDRWHSWKFFAVPMAQRLIRTRRVEMVWTTFPIATAHEIGLGISRRTPVPWVAEFRDPMWQGDYPPDPQLNRAWQALEREVFDSATRLVVTTPGAARDYQERFPKRATSLHIIENGYDEDVFARAETALPTRPATASAPGRTITLLHSGVIYPSERDPSCLFAALAALKSKASPVAQRLRIILRASGNVPQYRQMTAQLGIDDIVRLEPAVSYAQALEEMLTVDGLLILQASNCNSQVPAKLYEYFRARRPILALTDASGDTAAVLKGAGTGLIAPLDSAADIESALLRFVEQLDCGQWRPLAADVLQSYSREHQTGQLARLFEDALGARRAS